MDGLVGGVSCMFRLLGFFCYFYFVFWFICMFCCLVLVIIGVLLVFIFICKWEIFKLKGLGWNFEWVILFVKM